MIPKLSKVTLLLLVLLTFIHQINGYAQQNTFIVMDYTFDIELSDKTDVIDVDAIIRFDAPEKCDEAFVFHLHTKKGNEKYGMSISSITMDDKELEYTLSADSVLVKAPKAWNADHWNKLHIKYSGIPEDGLIISKNKFGNRTFFADNWPNRAHHWLAVYDHPNTKAGVNFNVTAPDHYTVIANGDLLETVVNSENGTKTSKYSTTYRIPTKVMVIGAADFAVQKAGSVGDVDVVSWVYEENKEAGFSDYKQAVPILEYYVSVFGAYPYRKLANVQSKTRYGGMENASAIFYNEGSVTGDGSAEYLIAHEIVHQWFGDCVTEKDWPHIWLSEGFATYFTHYYAEYMYGKDVRVKRMKGDIRRILAMAKRNPEAKIVQTDVDNLNQYLSAYSYQKAGWFLHMLRLELGDELFINLVRNYYFKFRFRNANTSDFLKLCNEMAKRDLTPFFEQWLYGTQIPLFTQNIHVYHDKAYIEIQQHSNMFYDVDLPVVIKLESGRVINHTLHIRQVKNHVESIQIGEGEKIKDIVWDPDGTLLYHMYENEDLVD